MLMMGSRCENFIADYYKLLNGRAGRRLLVRKGRLLRLWRLVRRRLRVRVLLTTVVTTGGRRRRLRELRSLRCRRWLRRLILLRRRLLGSSGLLRLRRGLRNRLLRLALRRRLTLRLRLRWLSRWLTLARAGRQNLRRRLGDFGLQFIEFLLDDILIIREIGLQPLKRAGVILGLEVAFEFVELLVAHLIGQADADTHLERLVNMF